MIRLVYDHEMEKDVMGKWAIERLGDPDLTDVRDLGAYVSIGVLKDGKAICVVIYNWYRQMKYGNDFRVIIVSEDPSWCLPGVLRELFRYPFEFAGCERLTAVIRDGNERSLKLCTGLGFRREGIMRRGYNGRTNALFLGMLRSECKWLQRGRGQLKAQDKNVEEGFRRASGTKSERNHRRAVGSEQGRHSTVG